MSYKFERHLLYTLGLSRKMTLPRRQMKSLLMMKACMLIARWVSKVHLLRDNEPWNPMK